MHPSQPIRAFATALLGLSAALLFMAPAAAADPKGHWMDTHKTCRFFAWNPFPEPQEAIEWRGECKDDVAHGTGTVQWDKDYQPAEKHTGQAVNGKWHGHVVSHLSSGVRYEGEFAYGRRVGLTRQIYSKAIAETLKTMSPYKNWFADGTWEKDEFVLPMLYSRFQERRVCPKAEQAKDQCQSVVRALLATEQATMTTLHQLALCMNHAEALMEIYDEKKTPDPKMVRTYGQVFEKIAQSAEKQGLSAHMDDAQKDTEPVMYASIQKTVDALMAKDKDNDEMDDAKAQQIANALTPYLQKNCAVYLK